MLRNRNSNINALLIGCGNIGAQYDFAEPKKVWTHARAFNLNKNISFTVTDIDSRIAEKVGKAYNVPVLNFKQINSLLNYDIISITTPTPAHFQYLENAILAKVPVVICEKPVSASLTELALLKKIYLKSNTKVLVNYIRRFQPSYIALKAWIAETVKNEICENIVIKYRRGILNNGGHAFDLIEFLFGEPITFRKFHSQTVSFDAFDYDPTMTASFTYGKTAINIIGIQDLSYPVFEMELFFTNTKVFISNNGNEISFKHYGKRMYRSKEKIISAGNILDYYMLPVIEKAVKLLRKKDEKDNFLEAVALNNRIVKVINANT